MCLLGIYIIQKAKWQICAVGDVNGFITSRPDQAVYAISRDTKYREGHSRLRSTQFSQE